MAGLGLHGACLAEPTPKYQVTSVLFLIIDSHHRSSSIAAAGLIHGPGT